MPELPELRRHVRPPSPAPGENGHDHERHERRQARRRLRRRIWTAGLAGAVLLVGSGALASVLVQPTTGARPDSDRSVFSFTPVALPADKPAALAGAAPCTPLRVLASLENADLVRSLAAGYLAEPRDVQGRCVSIEVTAEKSGFAADAAAAGFPNLPAEQRPNVWLPDSSIWIDLARFRGGAGSAGVSAPSTRTAQSAIIVAMPAELSAALGWKDKPPTWADVFAAAAAPTTWPDNGHPEWGTFKLGKTSPLVTTAGEAALIGSYGAAAGGMTELTPQVLADKKVTDAVKAVELSTTHYTSTPEQLILQARAADASGSVANFLSAVIVDEKAVWDYNRGVTSPDGVSRSQGEPPRQPLVPVYPSDGELFADNPGVVLTGEWTATRQVAAARDFLRFATTDTGQRAVRASGYRDINGRLDGAVATVGSLRAAVPNPIAMPSPRILAAAQAAFPEVRKRSQVLFLLDVSGSMDEQVSPGLSRLQAAKNAIVLALDHFTPTDRIGLAAFSARDDGAVTPGLVSPVAEYQAGRDQFVSRLSTLTSISYTPLYAAVSQFAQSQAAAWDPARINAIVLLSDGKDETQLPGTSKESMLARLAELRAATPVPVFTLAYGAGADTPTLQEIARVTGGQYFDATDPTRVSAVLGELVTSF